MSEYPTPTAQIEAISQLGINLLQELFKNKLEDLFPFHLQATCNVQSVCRSERDESCLYPGSFRMPGIFLGSVLAAAAGNAEINVLKSPNTRLMGVAFLHSHA